MEQEVSRWLLTQLGYNSSADSTLSSNCRGNLKGLWEFIIANYKTADSKRHIDHVLARHRKEQEAARRAPEQQREAKERRKRLQQVQKKAVELEQTLASFQARTEIQVHEATDQGCEHSLLQHVLHSTQAQAVLLQAFMNRGQQLLPELQARLSLLQSTLDNIKARCRSTGHTKASPAVQQQILMLSSSIRTGMHEAVQHVVKQHGMVLAATDLQQQQDQLGPWAAAGSGIQRSASPTLSNSATMLASRSQQQQAATQLAEGPQQLLQLCKLLHSFKLPPEVVNSAVQLLQHSPGLLWDVCAQLAQQNLLELSTRLDEAQRDMLAPLHWPGGSSLQQQQQQGLLQLKPDQQQLVVYGSSSSSVGSTSHRLPWASGLSMSATAALQQQGMSLPPELRVKMRLKDHVALHVQTEQALQRARATQQHLDEVLGSTPLLQAAILDGYDDASAVAGVSGGWEVQLAQLFLNAAKVHAQVGLLQQHEERLGQELMQLQEIKAVTVEKEEEVNQQMQEDYELNQLLHLATEDTMELAGALQVQQQTALQLLGIQLLPCETAAAEAARLAVGKQQHEVGVVQKLPVLDITQPVRASGGGQGPASAAAGTAHAGCSTGGGGSSSNPVLRKPTLLRLQAASRQLVLTGRATTGGKPLRAAGGSSTLTGLAGFDLLRGAGTSSDSNRKFGDSAAVAALKGVSLLDPLAPLRCPAALLLQTAGQYKEAEQLQQQADALVTTSTEVAASITAAVDKEARLQDKVAALHRHELQDMLPQLQALLDEAQAARTFAQDQLMLDLKHMWEMPAMHLVPDRKYHGKNCSQWLQEIQQLKVKRRELLSKQTQMA